MKCSNSPFNTRGSRVTIVVQVGAMKMYVAAVDKGSRVAIVVQVRAMKIYVAAVDTLGKMEIQ
jgi:hypothetical protein